MMLFFKPLFQVDKNDALFWCSICIIVLNFIFLSCQTETEIGSAGEQPTRVMFDDRRKSKESKGCQIGIPLTFIEDLYALKNPSINFFFLSIDNPL